MAARSATDALGISQGFIITLSVTRNTTGLPLSSYMFHPLKYFSPHTIFPLLPTNLTDIPPFLPGT